MTGRLILLEMSLSPYTHTLSYTVQDIQHLMSLDIFLLGFVRFGIFGRERTTVRLQPTGANAEK